RLVSDWSSDVCSSDLGVPVRPLVMTKIKSLTAHLKVRPFKALHKLNFGRTHAAMSGSGSSSDKGSSPRVFRNASTRLTGGGSGDGEGAAWAAAGAAGRALGAVSCSSGGRVYTPAKSKSVRAAREL